MNSKKFNLCEIVLHILTIILLFVKGMFNCYITRPSDSNLDVSNSYTDILLKGNILPIVFIVVIISSILLCIYWAVNKSGKEINIMHILLPLGATAIFFIIGILYANGEYATPIEVLATALYEGTETYSIDSIFYLESVVLISMCIFAVLKRKHYVKECEQDVQSESSNQVAP